MKHNQSYMGPLFSKTVCTTKCVLWVNGNVEDDKKEDKWF